MKYKVTLDIHGEPLIRLLARYAPFDITGVEELPPEPLDPVMSKGIGKQHALPPIRRKKWARKASIPMDLKAGINRIILEMLEVGPRHASDFKKPVSNAGYSPNSVNSRLGKLEAKGIVKRVGNGTWKLLTQSLPPVDITGAGQE